MLTSPDPNVGLTDRWLRAIVGIILLAGSVTGFGDPWRWLAALVGLVLLATVAFRVCPAYRFLGWSTRKE